MSGNAEDVALQSLQVLCMSVLSEKKVTIFATISAQKLFPRVIQVYAGFADFAGLYFLYFTKFATKFGNSTNRLAQFES